MSCEGCKYNSKEFSELTNWCDFGIHNDGFRYGTVVYSKIPCDNFKNIILRIIKEEDIKEINKKQIIILGQPFKEKNLSYHKADPVKQAKAKKYLMKCIQEMRR